MTEAEIADQYTKQQYIDYGDLNEKAEAQIRKAFSDGMTQPRKEIKPSNYEFSAAIKLLRDLADCQNGAPLEQHKAEWGEVMKSAYEFLDAHEKGLEVKPNEVEFELYEMLVKAYIEGAQPEERYKQDIAECADVYAEQQIMKFTEAKQKTTT